MVQGSKYKIAKYMYFYSYQ